MIKIQLPNFTETEVDLNFLAPCNTTKKLLQEMRDDIVKNLLPIYRDKTNPAEYVIVNQDMESLQDVSQALYDPSLKLFIMLREQKLSSPNF